MSLLGKDFEDAMKQLTSTLSTIEETANDLREVIAMLNALLSKIQIKP